LEFKLNDYDIHYQQEKKRNGLSTDAETKAIKCAFVLGLLILLGGGLELWL
jgi:hypothetical protein